MTAQVRIKDRIFYRPHASLAATVGDDPLAASLAVYAAGLVFAKSFFEVTCMGEPGLYRSHHGADISS